MKDYPIIFTASMIRAIRDRSKTQTRRLVTDKECPYVVGRRLWVRETHAFGHSEHGWLDGVNHKRLWDSNEFRFRGVLYRASFNASMKPVCEGFTPWRSPIHMPRWASRITLVVRSVREQRVQDITEFDAIAEGIARFESSPLAPEPKAAFAVLWDTVHGPGAWERNDWVWAVEFEVTT